jgi:hypothetical protein
MIPYMITELAAYLDRKDNYYFINVTTGGYGITSDEKTGSLEYLCSLLNSHVLDFFLKNVTTTFHGGYFAANKQYIEILPIKPIDFTDKHETAIHEHIVRLVQSMLSLHKQMPESKSKKHKVVMQRQIEATDREINRIVYDLYNLTKDEIAIVESDNP